MKNRASLSHLQDLRRTRSSGVITNLKSSYHAERWYLSYPLSYRQVAEMVNERGMDVHHTTVLILLAKHFLTLENPSLDSKPLLKVYKNHCVST